MKSLQSTLRWDMHSRFIWRFQHSAFLGLALDSSLLRGGQRRTVASTFGALRAINCFLFTSCATGALRNPPFMASDVCRSKQILGMKNRRLGRWAFTVLASFSCGLASYPKPLCKQKDSPLSYAEMKNFRNILITKYVCA